MQSKHILSVAALLAFVGLGTFLTSLTPPTEKIGLEAMESFVGTWVEADDDGKPTDKVMSIVVKTASGSVIMERLFPGTDDEMITMYYTENGELKLTHYCGCTNHPIMKAAHDAAGNLIFNCIGKGENFADCKTTTHMHDAIYRFDGKDKVHTTWRMMDGGEAGHIGDFHFVRKPELPMKAKPKVR